jgi:hypothetical protein
VTKKELLVVAVTAATRVAYLLRSELSPTYVFYWQLADGLREHGTLLLNGQPTAAFEPLYPAFIAAARWIHDAPSFVILAQIAVSCLGAFLLMRLARAMSDRDDAALAAGVVYAVYPYLVRQASAWMEITLLSTLLLGGWLAWARGRRHLAVTLLAFAALTRMTILPVLLVSVFLIFRREGWRRGLVAATIAAVLIGPLMVRTFRLERSILPTRQGENLYVGNNAYAAQMIPRYDLDLLSGEGAVLVRARLGLAPDADVPPAVLDHELTSEALRYLAADPRRALKAKAMNVVYFFDPRIVPYEPMDDDTTLSVTGDGRIVIDQPRVRPAWQNIAHTVAWVPVLVLGVAGMWRRYRLGRMGDLDVVCLASVAALTAVAAIYFPTTRMRMPLDPLFMAYAACALPPRRRVSATPI